MQNPRGGYDPACETLAEHFLQDEPALADRKGKLAAAIQQSVEDWIAMERPADIYDRPDETGKAPSSQF